MDLWTQEEVDRALMLVRKRSVLDMKFRSLCLSDPAAAIKSVSGKNLPKDLKLRFVENEGAHLTFVLPDSKQQELSDEELEFVAAAGNSPIYFIKRAL